MAIPSGKHTNITVERSANFSWENQLTKRQHMSPSSHPGARNLALGFAFIPRLRGRLCGLGTGDGQQTSAGVDHMWDDALGMTPWGWRLGMVLLLWYDHLEFIFPNCWCFFSEWSFWVVFDAWCNHLWSTLCYNIIIIRYLYIIYYPEYSVNSIGDWIFPHCLKSAKLHIFRSSAEWTSWATGFPPGFGPLGRETSPWPYLSCEFSSENFWVFFVKNDIN